MSTTNYIPFHLLCFWPCFGFIKQNYVKRCTGRGREVMTRVLFHVMCALRLLYFSIRVCICACVLVHLMTSGLPDQLSHFLLYLSRYLSLTPISLLSICSTIKEFYWPYLSDSSLYTIVKFKCLWFLKQESNLSLKKGSFLNHSVGLQHWTVPTLWPACAHFTLRQRVASA